MAYVLRAGAGHKIVAKYCKISLDTGLNLLSTDGRVLQVLNEVAAAQKLQQLSEHLCGKVDEWSVYSNNLQDEVDRLQAIVNKQSKVGRQVLADKNKLENTIKKQQKTTGRNETAINNAKTQLSPNKKARKKAKGKVIKFDA